MPLLNKKKFVRKKLPLNLMPRDKVFFCSTTNEVFVDYDEFWERLVLLNALVWTCEMTGKPNLTYQEALDSEGKAKSTLTTISPAMVKPILYITSCTRRGRIADTTEDVFDYIRDRYFVGEDVEAIVKNHWYDCKLTRIIMPPVDEIIQYEKDIADSDEEDETDDEDKGTDDKKKEGASPQMNGGMVNGNGGGDDSDDDIMIVRDDINQSPVKNNKQESTKAKALQKPEPTGLPTNPDDEDYPPFATIKYEVQEVDPWDYKECKLHIITWNQIRRPKSAFTKEKCKLFVKQCVRLSPEGYWSPKEALFQKYDISNMKFTDIFVGTLAKFEQSKLKNGSHMLMEMKRKEMVKMKRKEDRVKRKQMLMNGDDNEKSEDKIALKKAAIAKKRSEKKVIDNVTAAIFAVSKEGKKVMPTYTEEEKAAAQLKFEKMREERVMLIAKQKEQFQQKMENQKAERKMEKDMQREEMRLMSMCIMNYAKMREDLMLGTHKNLPTPLPVECRIPNECFGDFLMILEFVNSFANTLELKDVYSHGVSFDMLEHAVVEKEVAGVFNDVVQLLLGAIFSLQEEEDEEIGGTQHTLDMAVMKVKSDIEDPSAAIELANQAAIWSLQYQGTSLQKTPLDALTLTEVLRLHLLASGATSGANAFWRHANRGGFKNTDDPGLLFKISEPHIIKKLTSESVFDLTIDEKLKVLSVLVSQILTYASVRDTIDESADKLRNTTNNWRMQKFAEVRKLKEDMAMKKQKERDINRKQLDKANKKAVDHAASIQQKIDEMINGGKKEEKVKEEEDVEIIEETEEDRKEREEKEERALEKKKLEYMKKEKEVIEQIRNLSRSVYTFPLGQDRAYRKFWINDAIPALLVEDYDCFSGPCNDEKIPKGVEVHPTKNEDLKRRIKAVAEKQIKMETLTYANCELIAKHNQERELDKNSSDKENEGSPQKNSPNKSDGSMLKSPKTIERTRQLIENRNKMMVLREEIEDDREDLMDSIFDLKEQCGSEEEEKKEIKQVDGEKKEGIIEWKDKKEEVGEEGEKKEGTVEEGEKKEGIEEEGEKKDGIEEEGEKKDGIEEEGEKKEEIEEEGEKKEGIEEEEKNKEIFGLCTADDETCQVHTVDHDRPRWSFYSTGEDFEKLVNSLNPQGVRESELRQRLLNQKERILHIFEQCPAYKLNPTQEPDVSTIIEPKSKKSTRSQPNQSITTPESNLNFPLGTPIERILELTLRDMILEAEEKIHVGCLGLLKVLDRDIWRKSMVEGDPVCTDYQEVDYGGKKRIKEFKAEFGMEEEEATGANDSDLIHESDGTSSDANAMRDLAIAILQLSQSVDIKYLRQPLGEMDKQAKVRTKMENRLKRQKIMRDKKDDKKKAEVNMDLSSSDEEEDKVTASKAVTDNMLRQPIERWEKSLMSSTSFSQLFLHLASLDNSITWSRSALYTRCKICRRKNDPDKMLLCDECDKGFHMNCLKPKMKVVPTGDWFCDACKPKEKPKSPKKARQIYIEVEESDIGEEESEEEEEDDSEDDGEVNSEVCTACEYGGDLILCDTCPRSFHQECADLRKIPRGEWSCPLCKEEQEEKENKKGKKKKEKSKVQKLREKKEAGNKAEKRVAPKKGSEKQETKKSNEKSEKKGSEKQETKKINEKLEKKASEKLEKKASEKLEKKASEKQETKKVSEKAESKKNKLEKTVDIPPERASRRSIEGKQEKARETNKEQKKVEPTSRRSAGKRGEVKEKDVEKVHTSPSESVKKRGSKRSLETANEELEKFQKDKAEALLKDLLKNDDSDAFQEPINRKEVPDYYEIIKKPMDFRTVKKKLAKYKNDAEFVADVLLIFQNCQQYNYDHADEYKCAARLSKLFMQKVRSSGLESAGLVEDYTRPSKKRK